MDKYRLLFNTERNVKRLRLEAGTTHVIPSHPEKYSEGKYEKAFSLIPLGVQTGHYNYPPYLNTSIVYPSFLSPLKLALPFQQKRSVYSHLHIQMPHCAMLSMNLCILKCFGISNKNTNYKH